MSHYFKHTRIENRSTSALIYVAALAALTVPLPFAGAQAVGGGTAAPPTFTPAVPAVPAAPVAVARDTSADANLLYYAAQGDVAKFQRFLERGGSIAEARRKDGKTVLMLAANKGSLPIVQTAIKQSADVNDTDTIGMSALMLASRAGFPDVVKQLLEAGATVENRNVNGMTALTLAIQAQKPEIVDLLLANGAGANTKDNWGNTPLILAAGGQAGIVQSLIKAGADPKIRNSIGKTALGVAVAKKNEAVAAQLRTAGGFE